MFEDLKQAWNEAVSNFWRELGQEGEPGHGDAPRGQLAAMRHELGSAESELKRLDGEIGRARSAAQAERREVETCRRRRAMAEQIGDAETARLAASYAERAAERAAVLERKVEALEAELELRQRDVAEMKDAVDKAVAALAAGGAHAAEVAGGASGGGASAGGETGPTSGASGGPDEDLRVGDWYGTLDEERLQHEAELRRMRRQAAERAAEARLEELKKKMQ